MPAVQGLHDREMPPGVAPGLQRLPGQARRPAAPRQPGVGQVVVEHHITHPPVRQPRRQIREIVEHVRFQPQLRDQVGGKAAARRADRREHARREIGAALAAFPAPELCQDRGGDAVRGQFGLGGEQTFGEVAHHAPARRQVAFEPVAMGIDDPRQDDEPPQIDGPPDGPLHDQPARQRQPRGGQALARQQDIGALEIAGQRVHRAGSAASGSGAQPVSPQASSMVPSTESIQEIEGSNRPLSMK